MYFVSIFKFKSIFGGNRPILYVIISQFGLLKYVCIFCINKYHFFGMSFFSLVYLQYFSNLNCTGFAAFSNFWKLVEYRETISTKCSKLSKACSILEFSFSFKYICLENMFEASVLKIYVCGILNSILYFIIK